MFLFKKLKENLSEEEVQQTQQTSEQLETKQAESTEKKENNTGIMATLNGFYEVIKITYIPQMLDYITNEPLVVIWGMIALGLFAFYMGKKHGISESIKSAKLAGVPVCPNNQPCPDPAAPDPTPAPAPAPVAAPAAEPAAAAEPTVDVSAPDASGVTSST